MFRLNSGFKHAPDPSACGQVGALGTTLLCRESLAVQPGAPTAEAKPFTPVAGDPANEPHRQPIIAGFHTLFHTKKLTDVSIPEGPFVSSSCMQNRRGIGGRQGVHMRIKIPTLGKGLTQHWGSASIAAPIVPAAAGCTQLHGFSGREILQAQGNSKQLKGSQQQEMQKRGKAAGRGRTGSKALSRTMRSMGAPHTACSLS